jgi:hypothetical protein
LRKQDKIDKPARKRLSWSDISEMSPEEIAAHSRPERTKRSIKQGKRGRPRSENPMIHTAVVLPRDLLERLKQDAEAAGQGLSTEIRGRLLATYADTPSRDRQTRELVEGISLLDDYVAADVGKRWHEHPYAMAEFRGGLAELLAQYQPEGDEHVRPEPAGRLQRSDPDRLGGQDDMPEPIGRTYARLISRQQQREDNDDEQFSRLMEKDD